MTATGTVEPARAQGGAFGVTIRHALTGALAHGESVAVSGCCLTALEPVPGAFRADLLPETLSRTGGRAAWAEGRRVNLERSLGAADRLGGHFVQGHVDGRADVLLHERAGDGTSVLRVSLAERDAPLVVEKGSIALDGVSLTVARVGEGWLEVALIPETLRATTLGDAEPGGALNVEFDVLGKYVLRAVEAHAARRGEEE